MVQSQASGRSQIVGSTSGAEVHLPRRPARSLASTHSCCATVSRAGRFFHHFRPSKNLLDLWLSLPSSPSGAG